MSAKGGPAHYVEPATPFGGFVTVAGAQVPARTAPHLLVSGVSGSGKSRRVLAPAILMWDGPVLAVSSKPDLIALCLARRAAWGGRQRTYVLDLSGKVPDAALVGGAARVALDPVALLTGPDDALGMATLLMQCGGAGASAGPPSGGKDPIWETLATAPLAALLLAAGGDGVAWALKAVARVNGEQDGGDQPSWAAAVARLEGSEPLLAEALADTADLDAKMRDSVRITMVTALAPWQLSTVRVGAASLVFTPQMLADPDATLFVVAPADGVAAGAAVACVDVVTRRWQDNQSQERRLPRLLVVVDELCNTMPWPKLPTVVTESRAAGIHLLCAVQATSQFARRYGEAGMTELREVFPAILCLVGAPEKAILENAAWWYGQCERQKVSTDHHGKQSQSAELAATMEATDLLPRSIDEGRLLRGSRPGAPAGVVNEAGLLVDLVDVDAIGFEFED